MPEVGRPLKFETNEILQEKITNYFQDCINNERPFTVTGLALALDTTRETLLDYQEKDEFSDTIKKAKLIIHNYAEEKLFGDGNKTGIIFNLKNNWEWKDKTETDLTTKGERITGINYITPSADNSHTDPETTSGLPEITGQEN